MDIKEHCVHFGPSLQEYTPFVCLLLLPKSCSTTYTGDSLKEKLVNKLSGLVVRVSALRLGGRGLIPG